MVFVHIDRVLIFQKPYIGQAIIVDIGHFNGRSIESYSSESIGLFCELSLAIIEV